jgi:hypothetical protein
MSKKGLARLRRDTEKATKNQASNLRLAQSITVSDRPIRSEILPDITDGPRLGVDERAYNNYAFHWDVSYADTEGTWGWGEPRQWSDDEYHNVIERHLGALGNNSWQDVHGMTYNGANGYRKLCNKYQHLNTLCDEAQQRWNSDEIMCQFERPFRLRLGTDRRIWGIRVQHYLFMFWYERHHCICPPKN